ncbi:MAG: hypothetical protein WC635_07360 [Bacteriovorax sp.]|jgi:hypothetical protein
MKNWLYIPFLLLMAVTYTRLSENINAEQNFKSITRSPASVEISIECYNLPKQFNPHFISEECL